MREESEVSGVKKRALGANDGGRRVWWGWLALVWRRTYDLGSNHFAGTAPGSVAVDDSDAVFANGVFVGRHAVETQVSNDSGI